MKSIRRAVEDKTTRDLEVSEGRARVVAANGTDLVELANLTLVDKSLHLGEAVVVTTLKTCEIIR